MALRLAVIGCGGMSSTGHGPSHARLARELPELSLVACCDLNAAKASQYAAKFGFARSYTDLEAMIAAEQPEAISVITPVEHTCRVFCQVVGHGRPGSLLGYDRRGDQGPWLVRTVVRRLHRHSAIAGVDASDISWAEETVRLRERPSEAPRHPLD